MELFVAHCHREIRLLFSGFSGCVTLSFFLGIISRLLDINSLLEITYLKAPCNRAVHISSSWGPKYVPFTVPSWPMLVYSTTLLEFNVEICPQTKMPGKVALRQASHIQESPQLMFMDSGCSLSLTFFASQVAMLFFLFKLKHEQRSLHSVLCQCSHLRQADKENLKSQIRRASFQRLYIWFPFYFCLMEILQRFNCVVMPDSRKEDAALKGYK